MMAWVSGNKINILLDQPITQEMLKGLNRPYAARVGQHVPHNEPPRMWCSMTSSWIPTPSPGRLRNQLPLTEIPAILDRKSTRLNSSHSGESRMPSSA